jgi:DNA polymerase-3 subunit alpha
MPEADAAVRLNWEKETTGFYITGHPLDRYAEKIHHFVSLEKILAGKFKDKQLVRIGGLITAAKRITTKKGDTMCFAELADFTHSIETVVFPRTFYQHVNLLVPDMAVMMQGRIDMGDEGAKLLVDDVQSLEEYQPEYFLTVSNVGEDNTDAEMAALKEILQRHHGGQAVYLRLAGHWQKMPSDYWLDGTEQTTQEIQGLLGKEAVRQR